MVEISGGYGWRPLCCAMPPNEIVNHPVNVQRLLLGRFTLCIGVCLLAGSGAATAKGAVERFLRAAIDLFPTFEGIGDKLFHPVSCSHYPRMQEISLFEHPFTYANGEI